MKTLKRTSTTKLAARFDNELKQIIMNDLKVLKNAKIKFLNSLGPGSFTAA